MLKQRTCQLSHSFLGGRDIKVEVFRDIEPAAFSLRRLVYEMRNLSEVSEHPSRARRSFPRVERLHLCVNKIR